jgi:hypothetical protein
MAGREREFGDQPRVAGICRGMQLAQRCLERAFDRRAMEGHA